MFLGLGVWWAWIWLLFTSTRVTNLFPHEQQAAIVWQMYLISTVAIAVCMIVYAIAWKSITRFIDKRGFVIGFGVLASVATILLVACEISNMTLLFYIMTALTGVGTSALCIKAGRIYGSVTLTESLSAGCISLVVACSLYFVGVGIPQEMSLVFIAVLPLISGLMLALPTSEEFPSAVQGRAEALPFNAPERVMLRRVVASVAVIAFTAGVGKGICSMGAGTEAFSTGGTIAVFIIGVVGVIVLLLVERAKSAHGSAWSTPSSWLRA